MTSSRNPPTHPVDPSSIEGVRADRRRRHSSRVLPLAFLASALLHLLVVFVYPLLMDRLAPEEAVPGAFERAPGPEGTRLLSLLELPDPPTGVEEAVEIEEPEPVEEEVPAPVPEPAPAVAPADEDEDVEERGLTAAERLRPRMGDPRLWREILPESADLTDEERARLRVYQMIREWTDSMAVLDEAERRALDWTYTDEEGRRWGVSPGQIHLGRFSLPLPLHFVTPPGLRDEVDRRAWEWSEIERGAAAAAVREALRERGEEIRRRRDAERADTLSHRD